MENIKKESSWICNICKRVRMDDTENGNCTSPGCKAYAKRKEDKENPIEVKTKKKRVRKKKE